MNKAPQEDVSLRMKEEIIKQDISLKTEQVNYDFCKLFSSLSLLCSSFEGTDHFKHIADSIEIAKILVDSGETDETLIISAVLNDVVEKGTASHELIQKAFGDEVSKLVKECTASMEGGKPKKVVPTSRAGKLIMMAVKLHQSNLQ